MGAAPFPSSPPLATIGYEGLVQGQLIDRLRAAGITVLLDIRAVPNSRKPGFSKRLLAASLEAACIQYLHLQPLGTPKPGRIAARQGDAAAMEAIFATQLATEAAQICLSTARGIVATRPSCLLCFERDPHFCHRRLVADAIVAHTNQVIVHLTA